MKVQNQRAPKNDSRLLRIRLQLRQRAAGFWLRTFAKLALGIPLSFVAPALLAFIVFAGFLRGAPKSNPGWLVLFAISSAIIVPILYWLEWRSGGDFLVNEMRWQGTTADHYYTSSTAGWNARQDEATGAAYTEILLFAPRQTLSALGGIRRRVTVSGKQLKRAAEIVHTLLASESGLMVKALRDADDDPAHIERILCYLQFHDWIDLSADGKRAWLISTARKRLKSP